MTALEIKREVAAKHGLKVADLEGRCRTRRVSAARFEAMARLRRESRAGRQSLPWIGQQLGGRNHTTVMHGLRRYQAMEAEA